MEADLQQVDEARMMYEERLEVESQSQGRSLQLEDSQVWVLGVDFIASNYHFTILVSL